MITSVEPGRSRNVEFTIAMGTQLGRLRAEITRRLVLPIAAACIGIATMGSVLPSLAHVRYIVGAYNPTSLSDRVLDITTFVAVNVVPGLLVTFAIAVYLQLRYASWARASTLLRWLVRIPVYGEYLCLHLTASVFMALHTGSDELEMRPAQALEQMPLDRLWKRFLRPAIESFDRGDPVGKALAQCPFIDPMILDWLASPAAQTNINFEAATTFVLKRSERCAALLGNVTTAGVGAYIFALLGCYLDIIRSLVNGIEIIR